MIYHNKKTAKIKNGKQDNNFLLLIKYKKLKNDNEKLSDNYNKLLAVSKKLNLQYNKTITDYEKLSKDSGEKSLLISELESKNKILQASHNKLLNELNSINNQSYSYSDYHELLKKYSYLKSFLGFKNNESSNKELNISICSRCNGEGHIYQDSNNGYNYHNHLCLKCGGSGWNSVHDKNS